MKISPRKTAWLNADRGRSSSASPADFLRALGASSTVHLLALWSLTWIGLTPPAAGGRTHDARVIFAGLSAPSEPLPEPLREPERPVTLPPETEAEPIPDVDLVELAPPEEFPPRYEHRDLFEDLSTAMTMVIPESLTQESFELAGALATQRPEEVPPALDEPEAEAVEEEIAAVEEPTLGDNLGDSEPVLRHGLPPAYPKTAMRMGWQGVVVCRITISTDGKVKDVELEEGSGYAVLDKAALAAVRDWKFDPGTRDGELSELVILHKIRFRLT